MFRGDIGRLFAGLGQLVDSTPSDTPSGSTGTSSSSQGTDKDKSGTAAGPAGDAVGDKASRTGMRRHVVVWQETASQHWHNIPSATATGKGKGKGKAGGSSGVGELVGGVPPSSSSYDFTWTASG